MWATYATTSENRAQKKECAKHKEWGKLERVIEEEQGERFYVNKKYQYKICWKRTTADRQNWGKRIFPLLRSKSNNSNSCSHRLRLSGAGISYICGGLAYSNFVNSSLLLCYTRRIVVVMVCLRSAIFVDYFSSIFSNCFLHKFSLILPLTFSLSLSFPICTNMSEMTMIKVNLLFNLFNREQVLVFSTWVFYFVFFIQGFLFLFHETVFI